MVYDALTVFAISPMARDTQYVAVSGHCFIGWSLSHTSSQSKCFTFGHDKGDLRTKTLRALTPDYHLSTTTSAFFESSLMRHHRGAVRARRNMTSAYLFLEISPSPPRPRILVLWHTRIYIFHIANSTIPVYVLSLELRKTKDPLHRTFQIRTLHLRMPMT